MDIHGIFGDDAGEMNLLQLFRQSVNQPESEFVSFLQRLNSVKLPIPNLASKVRKMEYPLDPTNGVGFPPAFFYFVPRTQWCSGMVPEDPLEDAFITGADGYGLNLGCPLRLKRCLEILANLPTALRAGCEQDLAQASTHLPTVEEVLWLDLWQNGVRVSRSEGVPHRTHDWIIEGEGWKIRQECKVRPVDWVRLADGNEFCHMEGIFCGRPSKQLPDPPDSDALNVVSITGMGEVTEQLSAIIGRELSRYTNVQALVYRSFAGDGAVFSLSHEIASTILQRTAHQPALPYQPIYHIVFNRNEQTRRREKRAQLEAQSGITASFSPIFQLPLHSIPSPIKLHLPMMGYRIQILKRGEEGEPHFTVVPEYIAAGSVSKAMD